jgi:hypothetical protein
MRVERLYATQIGPYLPSIKLEEEGMTKVLIIDSAATGDGSVSRKLTASFAEQLRGAVDDENLGRRPRPMPPGPRSPFPIRSSASSRMRT